MSDSQATLSTLRDWMGGADRNVLNPDAHEAIFGGGSSSLEEIIGGIDWDALADDSDGDIDGVSGVEIGDLIDDDDIADGGVDSMVDKPSVNIGDEKIVASSMDGGIDEFIEAVKTMGGDDNEVSTSGGHMVVAGDEIDGGLDEYVVSVPIEIAAPADNIEIAPRPEGLDD